MHVTRVGLVDFRSYRDVVVELEPGVTSFVGRNGVGKTNLIEAISFLVPGRGLRRATIEEVAFSEGDGAWAVSALRRSLCVSRKGMRVSTGPRVLTSPLTPCASFTAARHIPASTPTRYAEAR